MPVVSGVRRWAVLAYIVADDDRETEDENVKKVRLDTVARRQLDSLRHAAKAQKLLVIAQVDFTRGTPVRYVFDGASGAPDVMEPLKESNAASVETVTIFFEWAKRVATNIAEGDPRYVVIFWGHGAGPAGLFLDTAPPNMDSSLKLPALASALERLQSPESPYVDLVIFHDCWVSTLEAAYELQQAVRFMIGSQGIIRPLDAVLPYEELFAAIKTAASANPKMVATILEHIQGHWKLLDANVSFSALMLDAAKSIMAPLAAFSAAFLNLPDAAADAVRDAMQNSAGGDGALVDVRTLCKTLRARVPLIHQEALDLERVANTLVAGYFAPANSTLTGVSLFRRPADERMDTTDFAKDVSWRDYSRLALSDSGWNDVAFETRFEPA